jgi:hypothetical protein
MIEAIGAGNNATEKCKKFDKFEYKHLELEAAYNTANASAVEAVGEIGDILFEIEKNAIKDASFRISRVCKLALESIQKYVVWARADELRTLTAKILATAKTCKKSGSYSAVSADLETVLNILKEALEYTAPNFFALGYYVTYSGKEIPEAVMPNVLDRNIETAEKVLNYAGFKNIIREEVDSDKAQGTVVGQSVEANVKIPLSTIIVLQVSKGQTELPPETQEPTIPPELLVSKVIPIPLPTGMAEPYVLTVRKGGEIVEILNIPVGAIQAEVELRGLGTEEFEVWIGESRAWTFSVMFTEDVIEPDDPTQESTGING